MKTYGSFIVFFHIIVIYFFQLRMVRLMRKICHNLLRITLSYRQKSSKQNTCICVPFLYFNVINNINRFGYIIECHIDLHLKENFHMKIGGMKHIECYIDFQIVFQSFVKNIIVPNTTVPPLLNANILFRPI